MRRSAFETFATVATVLLSSGTFAFSAPPSSDYRLTFAEEFGGTTLDPLKWGYNYSWGRQHNHSAYMTESQVIIGDGVLDLRAIKKRNANATDFWRDDFGWQQVDYTSGAIHSSGKFTMSSGYVEARMKLPGQLGSWPAFWMLKGGWPPEVDIMEFPRQAAGTNSQTDTYHAYHHYTGGTGSFGGTRDTSVDLTADYHTYAASWTSTSMSFYLDGVKWYTNNDAAAVAQAVNMYLILNNAVDGWADRPTDPNFQSDFLIDWVRVWEVPTSTANAINWNATAGSGSWDNAGLWDVMVPKYQDQIARFGTNDSLSVAVAWDNSRTVGGLSFDGTTAFTIGDTNAGLQMAHSSGLGSISVAANTAATQTISARMELFDDVAVNNNSAQSLVINGQIIGSGGLRFDGAGTVLIANNNSYTRDTLIDTGTQGPAVVRVNRSRPFGTVGTIVFNTAGNSTTGRLEILDGREVPNHISLSGRTNASVAIQNVSGTNVFSGTIDAIAGGNRYTIQSDAGLLKFTGAAAQAGGLSFKTSTTASRVFTFQGVGDGEVSGAITNGNGTIGVIKAGTGTWTLNGVNTYTGGTTVAAGKLVAGSQSALGLGALTVAAGATATIPSSVAGAIKVKSLSLAGTPAAPTAKLDLTSRSFIIDYSGAIGTKLTDIRSQLAAGRGEMNAAGLFNYSGAGVTSSTILAANATAGFNKFAIGVINNSDLNAANRYTTFGNASVDVDSILVRYTYNGDANLDGRIDAKDYALVNASIAANGVATLGWLSGDFTLDGKVNADDYAVLDFGFLSQGGPLGFDPIAIPEPAFLASLLPFVSLFRRNRR